MTNETSLGSPAASELLASRRHTLVLLAILSALTLAGIVQASGPGAVPSSEARIVGYLVTIGLQCLWVRFVHVGMKRRGRSVSELVGGRPGDAVALGADLLYAAGGLLLSYVAVAGVRSLLGDDAAKTAFLLPHGPVESVLWIGVSVAAGVCEEIVFRGYLQRQLAALTSSTAIAVVVQAIVFGVVHGYQGLRSTASAAAIGLVLGVLAWWRGNVRAGMVAHATWDILGGLLR